MQYYTQSKSENVRTIFIFVLVCIVIAMIELIGVIRPLQQLYTSLTAPFSQRSSLIVFHINMNINQVFSYWSATQTVDRLERENALLQAELAQLQSLKKENEELKALVTGTNATETITTRNTGTIINYAVPSVVAHTNKSIQVGQLVLSQNTLLGIVTESYGAQARIELLSSSQTKPLLIKTEQGVEGTIIGNNKRIVMTDIARDASIKPGERISTVGQEGIPRDIFIGTISDKVEEPTSPVLSFVVSQPISFFETTVVELK